MSNNSNNTESKTESKTELKTESNIEQEINTTKQNLIDNEIKSFYPFIIDVKTSLWSHRTQNSTSLDIIAVYLKGQKIIYIESKSYCESLLYRLMLPAIAVSSISTVLSLALSSYSYGSIIVSSLTAFNSFILAIISYLKLDGKSESYRVSAYKFDKLETRCEFFSGKILYSNYTKEDIEQKMVEFIDQLEKDIEEIKEVNQYVIPQPIRYKYPILYTTNVFSEIKKRGNIERIYIHELNTVYNKISNLMDKNKNIEGSIKLELDKLNNEKENLMIKIIRQRDSYLDIDKDITREIMDNIDKKNRNIWDYMCFSRRRMIKDNKTPKHEIEIEEYINKKNEIV
jgi:hypothetical protein